MMTDYHQHQSLSSSEVAAFLTDPIEWYHVYKLKDWQRKSATPAMEFGTLVHTLFEVGDFESLDVIVKPSDIDFRTKAGKAWRDEHAGIQIIDAESFRVLQAIWQNTQRNKWIMAAVLDGEKEEALIWDDPDFGLCRCKPDCVSGGDLLDWKTTIKATERGFLYEITERNYDVRMALYRRGLRFMRGIEYDVHFVAVQTSGGCEVVPYTLPDSWMDDAEARLFQAVDDMRNFDIERHCNRLPKVLTQPRYSELKLSDD